MVKDTTARDPRKRPAKVAASRTVPTIARTFTEHYDAARMDEALAILCANKTARERRRRRIESNIIKHAPTVVAVQISVPIVLGTATFDAVTLAIANQTVEMALEQVVEQEVTVYAVTIQVVTIEAPSTPPSAPSPPSTPTPPAGTVWWNGVDGNWSDPSLWEGGDPQNATRVVVCTDGESEASVTVRTQTYTRANRVRVCGSSADTPGLVLQKSLCIGPGCPG